MVAGSIFSFAFRKAIVMIDEYLAFPDLVRALGCEDAENEVLEHVYHGEEI